jgi:hypothetical protein
VPLLEHQILLGRCLQGLGAQAFTADTALGLTIDREELARLRNLVQGSGFRFTRHVQRSWCMGRTAGMAQLTLSLLPIEHRRRVVENSVDGGGDRTLDLASEAAAFLEFVAQHLTNPSHGLTVCRMEQAAYRASGAAVRFRPPDPSLFDHPDAMLRVGKGAALVRFLAEPQRLFDAIAAKGPLPPLSHRQFPVLFAPGLPKLYRAANNDEVAVWERLARPTAVPLLSRDGNAQRVIERLFSIGAADLIPRGSSGAADSQRLPRRRCSGLSDEAT